ncbi:hypothetical protein INR49_011274 [Caranx melampygus]|nr:hypothetical protein INR49_011274 [Caranx melampygus]
MSVPGTLSNKGFPTALERSSSSRSRSVVSRSGEAGLCEALPLHITHRRQNQRKDPVFFLW